VTTVEKKPLLELPVDWRELDAPHNGFYFPESRYARNAAMTLARLFSRQGTGFIEPADTLKESWTKLARKIGLRYVREREERMFWLSVSYQVVILNIAPAAANIAGEIKRIMAPGQPFYPPRHTYLKYATTSSAELERLDQMLVVILATVADEADRANIDRPTWFGELESWRNAVQTARFSVGKKPENEYFKGDGSGFYFAEIENQDIAIHEDGVVYVNDWTMGAPELRRLALALLEAAKLSEEAAKDQP
jgi:hypothetical protein